MLHLFHQGNSRCNDHTRALEVYIFLRDIYNTDVSNHRQAGFTSHIPCFCPIIFITVRNSSCGKVMFSQACVHGGGRCIPARTGADTPRTGIPACTGTDTPPPPNDHCSVQFFVSTLSIGHTLLPSSRL